MNNLSNQQEARRLRIYISEGDRWRGKPLDAALLDLMRQHHMAGATVFRGLAGFGAHSHLSSTSIETLSFNLPIVIELVDTPEKIASILEIIYPMIGEGLITQEDVKIIKYTHRFLNPLPADRLVSEVMTTNVVSLTPEMTVTQAWQQMLEKRIKAMPVVDSHNHVVGILTDEDLLDGAGIQQRLSVALRMETEDLKQELKDLQNLTLTVGAVMTRPVITANAGEALGVATARMVKAGLKRMPVVDDHDRLVGMLSRLDILRQVANAPRLPHAEQVPLQAVKTVQQVMSASIPMVNQDDDLAAVVEKFVSSESHRLIVVDDTGKAVGLISDSDVVSRIQPAQRRGLLQALRDFGQTPPSQQTALDLMSPGVLTAPPDLPVVEAARRMLKEGRKWMVVVDEEGIPLGLVDRQILLEAITSYYPGESSAKPEPPEASLDTSEKK